MHIFATVSRFIMQERIMPLSLSLLSVHSRQQFPTGKRPDRRLPDRLLQRELRQDLRLQPRRGMSTLFNTTYTRFLLNSCSKTSRRYYRKGVFVELYLDDTHT